MTDREALIRLLADWPRPAVTTGNPSGLERRIRQAVGDVLVAPERVGRGDLAGLIGHWLNAERTRGLRGGIWAPRHELWPDESAWRGAGVRVESREAGRMLLTPDEPWRPEWLPGAATHHPLEDAIAAVDRRPVDDGAPVLDPCLQDLLDPDFVRFKSHGQAQAVRAAFLAPLEQTLLAVLPTGSGKSLVGLAPMLAECRGPGLTLIVTPTVALAVDQAYAARRDLERLGKRVSTSLVWHSDLGEEDRAEVKRAIRDGRQPVLFASPESVLRSLSPALFRAADEGLLRSIVIDECHLVSQWGNDFRPEFQALAGMWRELKSRGRFRTTLLTATLTQEGYSTIRTLFDGPIHVSAAVSLRREPTYWSAAVSSPDEKRQRFLEVCRRLPRPFLVYVTLREDARRWAEVLRNDGMRRVRSVVGGDSDRDEVVRAWRGDEIDAVVATSAFGLGMDKRDVRAVLHVCVPETVDRYYQEVGRGGRDGRACVSIVLHEKADWNDAERLNAERVVSTTIGLQRWKAMFGSREAGSEKSVTFAVDLTAQRSGVEQDSDANVGWNLRTLNLMARAGFVRLHHQPPPDPQPALGESVAEFETRRSAEFERYFATAWVEILPGRRHDDAAAWEAEIQRERLRTFGAATGQLGVLRALLRGDAEFGETLSRTYNLEAPADGLIVSVEAECAGCPVCRSEARTPYTGAAARPGEPPIPHVAVESRLRAAAFAPADAELVVVTYRAPDDDRELHRWRRTLLEDLLPKLVECGVREVAAAAYWGEDRRFRRLHERGDERYLLHSSVEDEGDAWFVPRVTLIEPSASKTLPAHLWRLRRPFHLLIAPESLEDPSRPGSPYLGRTVRLEQFLNRLDEVNR